MAPLPFYIEVFKYDSPGKREQNLDGTKHAELSTDAQHTEMVDALIGSHARVFVAYYLDGERISPEEVDRLLRNR